MTAGVTAATADTASMALVAELQEAIAGEVRFDRLSRQLYSTDASDFRKEPVGVVIPRQVGDVCQAMRIAARHGLQVIARGGGSSVSGQTVGPGLVLDLSKYLNRIIELNLAERWVEVESGVVLDVLNATVGRHGLMVGPDPSSSAVATLGGMAGNNSTGSHSFPYAEGPQIMKPLAPAGMITRPGGTIILAADCRSPLSEVYFAACEEFRARHGANLRQAVLDHFAANRPIMPDAPPELNMSMAQTILAQHDFRVILVTGDLGARQIERLGFLPAASLAEAMALAGEGEAEPTINIVPAGGVILPVVGQGSPQSDQGAP